MTRRAVGGAALALVLLPACLPTGRAPGAWVAAEPPPSTFQALYRVRASGGGGTSLRTRAWVAVDASAQRIAAEILGPMGGTRAQFDGDPRRIRACLLEEGVFLDERSGAEIMEATLGIPFQVAELVQILRGRRPDGGLTSPYGVRGADGVSWKVRWRFSGAPVPSLLTVESSKGRLELHLLKLASREPPPEPFRPPPDARRVDAAAFRSLLLP